MHKALPITGRANPKRKVRKLGKNIPTLERLCCCKKNEKIKPIRIRPYKNSSSTTTTESSLRQNGDWTISSGKNTSEEGDLRTASTNADSTEDKRSLRERRDEILRHIGGSKRNHRE